jgi:heat shock protein HtpX
MAMNFWEAQRHARRRTLIYISLFVLLTVGMAILSEVALRFLAEDSYESSFPLIGLAFLAVTFAFAGYNYGMYSQYGGGYIAESVGAYRIDSSTTDFKERQLLNIVEETAIATSLPMPAVYIIPAREINAFAAGMKPENAAIAITEGALIRLNRDEVQGVIAHEFGHIYNGDMVIGTRLAAMVMGFFFVLYVGLRLLQFGTASRGRDSRNPVAIAALVFLVAGAFTWLGGAILKAAVSRQCEYRADACAVQFTRNPSGIANALRKISKETYQDMPKDGTALSHMYLEDHSSIFATHPPIQKRIRAIEAGEGESIQ